MDQPLDHPFRGPSMAPQKVGSGAWGFPSWSSAFHGSNDTTIFSSSLPVLPHEKLKFRDLETVVQSADDTSSKLNNIHQDLDGKDSLEGIAIGTLLPDDEDELLAGIMDDFDLTELPSQVEDLEEYDVFGSGGGMELDYDPQERLTMSLARASLNDSYPGNGTGQYGPANGVAVAREHPYGEHPSRTLFVRNINSNVEHTELRTLFEENRKTLSQWCGSRLREVTHQSLDLRLLVRRQCDRGVSTRGGHELSREALKSIFSCTTIF